MDRKFMAICILGVIAAIVAMSGCTSGPAANATLKPSPAPVVNKTMTNVSDSSGNVGIPENNTTFTGVNPVATMVNNTTKATYPAGTPTVMPK